MPTSLSSKPVLALTMGDPAGIGPEIILKALGNPAVRGMAEYIVVGDLKVLSKAERALDKRRLPHAAGLSKLNILDLDNVPSRGFSFGREKTACGRASIECVKKAFELVKCGAAAGMVTAPISKSAVKKSGFPFHGHTEYLAALAGAKSFAMMLAGGPLKVSLVTRHVPVRDIAGKINVENISGTIALTFEALRSDFGIARPRIAVAALNPHAGEGGIFGAEEKKIISPAVEKFHRWGVAGPLPADAVFYDAYRGRYDCVVCLYHDQGLIPLKMIARDSGVNITIGLGFVRTSPDHGTAFDIAGRGEASSGSMEAAIQTAAKMISNRRRNAIKKRY